MGLLISFEGCEGCGKSTQSNRLAARLSGLGFRPVVTHEPGGTPVGEDLRRVLKKTRDSAVTPEAELLLFAAARSQLTRYVILPALQQGGIVICDRYADSTLAYQGYGRGVPLDTVESVNQIATTGLRPDLVVLLDMDPACSLRRKRLPRDRFEHEDLAFHQRVREGYLTLAHADPARWLVLDAQRPPAATSRSIWDRVSLLLDTSAILRNATR